MRLPDTGVVVLYFAYGMRQSNLQRGEPHEAVADMGAFVAPVGEWP